VCARDRGEVIRGINTSARKDKQMTEVYTLRCKEKEAREKIRK